MQIIDSNSDLWTLKSVKPMTYNTWLAIASPSRFKTAGKRRQRCKESEIFDSDSAPASAEYTPTPKHFKDLHFDSCLNSKVNYLNFWQCLIDRIRFSHKKDQKNISNESADHCNTCQLLLR